MERPTSSVPRNCLIDLHSLSTKIDWTTHSIDVIIKILNLTIHTDELLSEKPSSGMEQESGYSDTVYHGHDYTRSYNNDDDKYFTSEPMNHVWPVVPYR